jgi:hypothetical protein
VEIGPLALIPVSLRVAELELKVLVLQLQLVKTLELG